MWLGVEAIPGKWNEALLTPEIVQLRESGKLGADGLIGEDFHWVNRGVFVGGRHDTGHGARRRGI